MATCSLCGSLLEINDQNCGVCTTTYDYFTGIYTSKCDECLAGFKFEKEICVKVEQTSYCKKYDKQKPEICTECKEGRFLVPDENLCMKECPKGYTE